MGYFYKENKKLEEKVDLYFKSLSIFNEKHFDGQLSIVLLGSLSRGEGTWIKQNGKDILVSDIEFFTIHPDSMADFKEYDEYIQACAKEIFKENGSSLFHVDNSYIPKSKQKCLEKKLLIYDAIHFGKCVVGEDVMNHFPQVDINNINLYDIRDILTHRIFSIIYYGFPLKAKGEIEQYGYSLAKNSLDLMTVILAENKILESGFINRYERIKQLEIDDRLKRYFGFCLSIKLGKKCDTPFTIEEMETIFISLIKSLSENFNVCHLNRKSNIKHIIRRRLGILKRAIKYRRLAWPKKHLLNLIQCFENGQKIAEKSKKDNLVLNGYPL